MRSSYLAAVTIQPVNTADTESTNGTVSKYNIEVDSNSNATTSEPNKGNSTITAVGAKEALNCTANGTISTNNDTATNGSNSIDNDTESRNSTVSEYSTEVDSKSNATMSEPDEGNSTITGVGDNEAHNSTANGPISTDNDTAINGSNSIGNGTDNSTIAPNSKDTSSKNDADASNTTTEPTSKDEESPEGRKSTYIVCNFGFLLLSNC